MTGNNKTAPVLSQRALQQLLEGNKSKFIAVMVGDEVVHRVHRAVAMRFSGVWKNSLSNPDCGVVTLSFPPGPPVPVVPSTGKAEQDTSKGTGTAEVPPRLSLAQKNRLALKFVVQWMEKGGADPKGDNAVAYPKTRPGLESVLSLAERLEVRELADRVKLDLRRAPVATRKVCEKCPRFEHPGEPCHACFICKEVGHYKDQCPVREQRRLDFLEREKRREEQAERTRLWKEANARRRKIWEEQRRVQEERDLRHGIRTGQVGVGADGKMKWRWEKTI